MKKIIAILIICLFPTSSAHGQTIAPDTLTFKKTYNMPAMSEYEIYRYTAGWCNIWMEFYGSSCGRYGTDGKCYLCYFYGQDLGKISADIFPTVYLIYKEGAFDLVFTEIAARWKNKYVDCISTHDDILNRNAFWLMSYKAGILDLIRSRSEELFYLVVASMDEYLKVGPPMELSPVE